MELAPINEGAQVPNSIAGALGMQLPSGRPPQEALAMALASRNLLLVLDNCEHLADDIASLIDLLRARAPNVRLLVTSQESLKCRDEQVYRLGALAVPASAQLEDAAAVRRRSAVRRTRACGRLPVSTGQRQRRSGGRHLPATGRHSARY